MRTCIAILPRLALTVAHEAKTRLFERLEGKVKQECGFVCLDDVEYFFWTSTMVNFDVRTYTFSCSLKNISVILFPQCCRSSGFIRQFQICRFSPILWQKAYFFKAFGVPLSKKAWQKCRGWNCCEEVKEFERTPLLQSDIFKR
jgi:hypothetical protein